MTFWGHWEKEPFKTNPGGRGRGEGGPREPMHVPTTSTYHGITCAAVLTRTVRVALKVSQVVLEFVTLER